MKIVNNAIKGDNDIPPAPINRLKGIVDFWNFYLFIFYQFSKFFQIHLQRREPNKLNTVL